MRETGKAKRQNIQIGNALAGLLDSGLCQATSTGARLETLASRYLAMVGDPTLYPVGWSISTWAAIVRAVRAIDTRPGTATYTLTGYIKAQKADAKLGYAVESLSQPALHALIAMVERAVAADSTGSDTALATFLAAAGVKLGA